MKIVISSGHGKYIRGAKGVLDEVDEARRVVEQVAACLRAANVPVVTFHDNTSTTQSQNLNTIVNFHNSQTRDLDVSVHFNCYQSTSKPMGTECLYKTQKDLSAKVAKGIADVSGLINRGAKYRSDLKFLNATAKPAILIEVCFVDSTADADLYGNKFDEICQSIAQSVSGASAPGPTPPAQKPTLRKGDKGTYVKELQGSLNSQLAGCNLVVDGDFGNLTDQAVRNFQKTRALDVDGICGPQTWGALDSEAPPVPPPPRPPSTLSDADVARIIDIAKKSAIYRYNWSGRGVAPPGYTEGIAVAYAITHLQLQAGVSWAVAMAQANTHNASKDVLSWYDGFYSDLGMSNAVSGPDTMRHLWALMLGLGMRESSGRHCEGRDQSASNTTSDTAEAGLFQQSWNSSSSTPEMKNLMDYFDESDSDCHLDIFKQGVSCSSSEWSCYGSGNGYKFQEMCKYCPTFCAQCCGSGLRTIRQHWGPINRYEAELRSDADAMLNQVMQYLDSRPVDPEGIEVGEPEVA